MSRTNVSNVKPVTFSAPKVGMSFSDEATSTIELISRTSDVRTLTDSDTICIFIDNGRIVNSQGKVKSETMSSEEIFSSSSPRQQLESVWNMIITLSKVTEELR